MTQHDSIPFLTGMAAQLGPPSDRIGEVERNRAWLAKQDKAAFDRMRKQADELKAFLEPCRLDMHEPDEQSVSAKIFGDHLDNAFGNGINTDAINGGYQEFVVVLAKDVVQGQKRQRVVTKNLAINLADLLALARLADVSTLRLYYKLRVN